jgi:hypothetical protein
MQFFTNSVPSNAYYEYALQCVCELGLGKAVEVTCGVRGADGMYERYEYSFGPAELGYDIDMDKPLDNISSGDCYASVLLVKLQQCLLYASHWLVIAAVLLAHM